MFPSLGDGIQQQYELNWLPVAAAEAAQAPPPDPAQMAQTAIARMKLQPITIGAYPGTLEYSPNARGVVNLNMWLWADNPTETTWGPTSRTVTLNGYTLTATAQAQHITWNMGNGDTLQCTKAEPWYPNKKPNQKAPTCGYIYTEPGTYQITATTHWHVDWTGLGQTGTIELDLTRTETIKVIEIWTLQCATRGCK